MSDPYDSDLARQQFAVDRSHKDAESSNAMARGTAQAAILINGGAATAVLAFLAKGNLPLSVFRTSAVCLAIYAIGVLAGACMMFCTVRSLDYYSLRWRLEAHPEEGADATKNRRLGEKWWKNMKRCFYASMAAFIVASGTLAAVLFYAESTVASTQSPVTSAAPSAPR